VIIRHNTETICSTSSTAADHWFRVQWKARLHVLSDLLKTTAPSLSPEAHLMRRFLAWTFIALSAAEILVLILWLMHGGRTALVMLVVIPLFGLASLGYAYRLAGRNRVDAAVFVTSGLIWAVSLIAGGSRGGGLLAVAALLALAPVVVGVAYSSRIAILRIILISVAVCAAASVLNTFDDLMPTQITETSIRWVEGIVATTFVALFSFSLWHSASRLREMLARMQESNRALAESERSLERKVEERTRQLQDELQVAAQYVRSLLPPPISNDRGLSVHWVYEPSAALGGDAFTYLRLDAEHDALALLDVCGHGVGAALHGVAAIQALRSQRLPGIDLRDPERVVAAMNDAFPMEEHGDLFFSLWYGVLDRSSRTLRYVSAGHPPALLIEQDEFGAPRVQELHTGGALIGILPGVSYESAEVQLGPDCELIVFSDGAYELPQPSGAMLPWPDFVGAVASGPTGHPLRPNEILDFARKQMGRERLDDDFSVVNVSFRGAA
jgi:serine phosphatase RsbU (regulator of sigma subunit)